MPRHDSQSKRSASRAGQGRERIRVLPPGGVKISRLRYRVGATLGVSVVLGVALAAAGLAAASAAVSRPTAGLIRLSLGSLRGGQAAVAQVRWPQSGVSSLSIVLNGTKVMSALSQQVAADGTRRLELSAANGLRWRRNTLVVRVVMFDGPVADRAQEVRA